MTPRPDAVHLGFAIRKQRMARNYRLKSFAVDLGVSQRTLSALESGKRAWTPQMAARAIQLLRRPEQWPDAGRPKP